MNPPRDRHEFDELLRNTTNYEKMPAFHQGRVRADLQRMTAYTRRLGHPERAAPVLHLTGTKGKGSTATFLERILRGQGETTGLHTSPHLHRMEERVLIDGEPIGEAALLAATCEVVRAEEQLVGVGFPTYFELMTLIAFLEFRRRAVGVAIHEVGLGGRLDATNVVAPEVCGVTNVALEHTGVLGGTIEEIAHEKAGIVKAGATLVLGLRTGDAGAPPFEAAARDAGAGVRRRDVDFRVVAYQAGAGEASVSIETWRSRFDGLVTPVLGRHQADNLALAIAMADAFLEPRGERIDPDRLRAAVAAVRIPGRLEPIAGDPTVVIDGAHTKDSVAAAVAAVREAWQDRRIVALFGLASDKDRDGCARALAGVDAVVTTSYENPRASDPIELAAAIAAFGGRAEPEPDPRIALDRARDLAENQGLVLVVGSLYLAGIVRARLLGIGSAAETRAE